MNQKQLYDRYGDVGDMTKFDAALQRAYQTTREQDQTAPKKRRFPVTAAKAGSLAVACVCVILVVTNMINPAFAQSLPVVGTLFAMLNQQKEEENIYQFNREQVPEIASQMVPVTEGTAYGSDNGVEMTVMESYYDGKMLYLVTEMIADFDPNDERIYYDFQITVDGKEIDFSFNTSAAAWQKQEENRYISDRLTTYIPEQYQSSQENVTIDYVVRIRRGTDTNADGSLNMQQLAEIPLRFQVQLDKEKEFTAASQEPKNGYTLEKLASTPAGTEVTVSYENNPRDLASIHLQVWHEDTEVYLNSGNTFYADEAQTRINTTYSGESLPKGAELVRVVVIKSMHETRDTEIMAEFFVNLKTGEVS